MATPSENTAAGSDLKPPAEDASPPVSNQDTDANISSDSGLPTSDDVPGSKTTSASDTGATGTSDSRTNAGATGTNTSVSDTSGTALDSDEDEGVFSGILSMMKNKLHLGEDKKVDDTPKVLNSVDVEGVVEYIKSGKCKKIITMAGAGISTSAGIPDFRSPGSGLYSNLAKYDLPYPEAIFELDYFCKDPQPFFTLARELYPGSFNPTPCHYFIKLLEKKGLLLRHYTQNIDTLEHIAGISEERVVEAHGSFRTAHCLHCNKLYQQEWVKDEIFAERVPSCESCSGVVKPDIVFFGEGLPPKFFSCLRSDFPQCDLLIILGTSLTVQPFASLIENVPPTCPRLLINREAVGIDSLPGMMQRLLASMGRGLQLNCAGNRRDVALLGDCDEGCVKLMEKMGWKDEFDAMMEEEKNRSKTEQK